MSTIAKRRTAILLAAAKISGLCFLSGEFNRREFAALVAAVAKGLFLALTATAPEIIFSSFQFDGVWAFLGNGRIGHEYCLLLHMNLMSPEAATKARYNVAKKLIIPYFGI